MDRQIINKYDLSDSVPRQKLNPYRTLKSVYLFTSDFPSVHQECAEKSSLQLPGPDKNKNKGVRFKPKQSKYTNCKAINT